MKILLDTNIIIHREANASNDPNIGLLYRWIDHLKHEKYIHKATVEEINKNPNEQTKKTFEIKMKNYKLLSTDIPICDAVAAVSKEQDKNDNDRIDSILLNEVVSERIDFLVTEDKKAHLKARLLNISDKVFSINTFLEKVTNENPKLINYKVLSISEELFGKIDVNDEFFNDFRDDYKNFNKWFIRKSEEPAYVFMQNGKVKAFLYIKVENDEDYSDIVPIFQKKKRLKIGTFKVDYNGYRIGERFLKIVFDNALRNRVDEIYVTIFNKRPGQAMLINLLEEYGFEGYGKKMSENGNEQVFVRRFSPCINEHSPKKSFPFLSAKRNYYFAPIKPEYHTNLLPDSILKTESPGDFKSGASYRNAIEKIFISRSYFRDLKKGDVLVFYRTGGYYASVITTLGIVESTLDNIRSEELFVNACSNRSVFTQNELAEWCNKIPSMRPFIVSFLFAYSFPKRINLQRLIELGIIADVKSAPRGFEKISREHFDIIMKETNADESIVVD